MNLGAVLIDFDEVINGEELQIPGTNFMDKTLKHPESTYEPYFWSCPISGKKMYQGLEPFSLHSGI